MAYPNYYSPFYPQTSLYGTQPTAPTTPQPTQSNGITWVQGEASAKSYPVMAGQSILLMDSENPVMYIKSTDQSGMPLPLRVFDYTERKSENTAPNNAVQPKTDYVSRDEFNAFKEAVRAEIEQANKPTPIRKTTKGE